MILACLSSLTGEKWERLLSSSHCLALVTDLAIRTPAIFGRRYLSTDAFGTHIQPTRGIEPTRKYRGGFCCGVSFAGDTSLRFHLTVPQVRTRPIHAL